MRAFRVLGAALAVVAIGALAGCGGDDDEETTAATTEETTAADSGGGGTSVGMSEYAFDPSDISVASGDTITAENSGEIPHNLTIEDNGEELAATEDVDPGSSGEVTVDADPGDYDVICTIPGHADQGMTGTITVE